MEDFQSVMERKKKISLEKEISSPAEWKAKSFPCGTLWVIACEITPKSIIWFPDSFSLPFGRMQNYIEAPCWQAYCAS